MATAPLTDNDLLRRCRDGDRAAFSEIVFRYESLIRSVAVGVCGDRTNSEDIAQEAFVSAWQKLDDLRDASKLRSWLCSIARNRALQSLRHSSRRPEGHAMAIDEVSEPWTTGPTPDESLAKREEEQIVWRVVAGLPHVLREVLVLYYCDRCSTTVIAAELGISKQAVRQRLVRGRHALRERVAHLVEASLRRGHFCAEGLGATTMVVAPGIIAANSTTLTATTTNIAVMTKLQAAVAGVALATLGTIPFIVLQNKTISELRKKNEMIVHSGLEAGTEQSASKGGELDAADSLQSHSLDTLRSLLADRPSHRSTALLWQQAEKLSSMQIQTLLLEAVQGDVADWRNKEIVALLFERLGQVDPKAAAQLVANLEANQLGNALPHLAAISPSAAANIYKNMSEEERRVVPIDGFLESLSSADFAVATEVMGLLPVGRRPAASRVLVEAVSADDPEIALAFLDTLNGDELAGGLSDLNALGRLAAHAPEQTAGLLERLPITSSAVPKYAELAKVWAAADVPSALAWAESIDFEGIRSGALSALYLSWAKTDHSSANAALERIANPTLRNNIFDQMTAAAIGRDPVKTEQWVRATLDGDQRMYSLALLGAHMASSDLDRAKQLLQEAADGNVSRLAWPSHKIAYTFAQRDPAAAARWAMTLPERASSQQHGAEGVVRAWVATDPVAASEWVATLPSGGTRNGAIYHLVEGIKNSDPAAAFQWANSIEGDLDKRLSLLKRATSTWTMSSPDDAKSAIEGLSLPADQKKPLFDQLRY